MTKANNIDAILANYTINDTGCWLHNLTPHPKDGYVRVRYQGKKWLAHRLSFTHYKGPLAKGMCACHSCDIRHCINPDHLFEGTQYDNIQDMVMKGRNWVGVGEANPNAKLTVNDIVLIRSRTSSTTASLAREFGVAWTTMTKIRKGLLWT